MNLFDEFNRKKMFAPLRPLYESRRFALVFASIYFVILLFFALSFHRVGDFGVETDFYGGFVPEARDFLQGKITIDSYHGPLYPWILGLTSQLAGDMFRSGILISVLSASFSLFLIFGLIKSVFGADYAFVTTVFVAINLIFIQYSYSAGSDMLFVALAMSGLFFLFRTPMITISGLVLSAAAMALAYLTRYNGIVFSIAIPVAILLQAVKVEKLSRFKVVLIWLVIFLAVISPWSIYLRLNRGSFFFNKDYQNMAYELFARGRITWDEFWFRYAASYTSYLDVFLKAPLPFVVTILRNTYTHLISDVCQLNYSFAGILSIGGAFFFAFSHPNKRMVGLALVFAFFFLLLVPIFYSERFGIFLIPMYGMFFAVYFQYLLSKSGDRKIANLVVNSVVIIIMLASYTYAYSFNARNISSGPNDMLLAKKWFHESYGDQNENVKIAARKPHIAYVLGMEFYQYPMIGQYDSLIGRLRRDSVRFLYYGPFEANDGPWDAVSF